MGAVTRWQIPEALPVDWQMRTLDTASITAGYLEDGRFRQRVEHAPLPGVTPAMCLWYLECAGRPLTWRGHTALAYRFWHPRDHIFFQRRGSFGPGDRWHIVEAFGADRRFLLNQIFGRESPAIPGERQGNTGCSRLGQDISRAGREAGHG